MTNNTSYNGDSHANIPRGWKLVKFGDVVKDVKESEKNPTEFGLERYIGLEHLTPESLRVGRWGSLSEDDVSFSKRFRTGQVLFGKRRAYQRKVAIAEFDGICSSDILTFEAKDGLLPELLPFVVQSDAFFNHALGTSSGSLSPRTRWSQLKEFQFPLPPECVQQEVVDMLLAAEDAIREYGAVLSHLESVDLAISEYLFGGNSSGVWKEITAEEACDRITVGIVVTPSKYYTETGVPCFRSANVRRGEIQDSDWVFISEEAHAQHAKSIVNAGDVMVVRSGANAGMCCVVPDEYDGSNSIDIVFATPRQRMLVPGWLEMFINSRAGRREILKGERGLAQKHFGVTAMKHLKFPLPPIESQKTWVELVSAFRECSTRTSLAIERLKSLQKSIVCKSLFAVVEQEKVLA